MDPPTIAPACAAAERRHLGVWSACAAESQCIAPYAHIGVLLYVGVTAAESGSAQVSPLLPKTSAEPLWLVRPADNRVALLCGLV